MPIKRIGLIGIWTKCINHSIAALMASHKKHQSLTIDLPHELRPLHSKHQAKK